MPRTAAQWHQIRNATRHRILEGAMEMFKKKGIHGASMESIARQVHVSKGLAYHYFASKEDLLAAVVEVWLDELASLWEGLDSEPDPVRRLERVIDRFCRSLESDPDRYRLYLVIFMEWQYLPSIEAAGRRRRKLARQMDRVRSASRNLFTLLGSPDPSLEVVFFRLLTSGLAAEYIMSRKSFPMKAVKARILSQYRLLAKEAGH